VILQATAYRSEKNRLKPPSEKTGKGGKRGRKKKQQGKKNVLKRNHKSAKEREHGGGEKKWERELRCREGIRGEKKRSETTTLLKIKRGNRGTSTRKQQGETSTQLRDHQKLTQKKGRKETDSDVAPTGRTTGGTRIKK